MNNAIASSTTVYPFQHFNNTQIVGYQGKAVTVHPGLNNWSVQSGAFKSPANSFSLNNAFGYDDAQKISKAITGSAPIAHAIGRKVVIKAITGGVIGIGLSLLAQEGLEYAAQQWQHTSLPLGAPPTLTFVTTDGLWAYAPGNVFQPNPCASGGSLTGGLSSQPQFPQNPSYIGYSCILFGGNPFLTTTTPITQVQAEEIASNSSITPTDNDYQMMLAAGWALPLTTDPLVTIDLPNINSTDLAYLTSKGYFQPTPTSLAGPNGSPVTDPVTGTTKQPMVQVDPAPNGGVSLTPYDQPLDANGDPVVDTNGNPVSIPSNNTDPCALNPERAGCASLGTPESDTITPTEKTVTGQFNSFNISGQCPSDKTFSVAGMTHTIQMSPICGAAQNYIKPFLLLMASVTAYFIFVGGLRT